MRPKTAVADLVYLDKFASRKVGTAGPAALAETPDSLEAWITRYLDLAVRGVRSPAVTEKITLHLARFLAYFVRSYGHDRISCAG